MQGKEILSVNHDKTSHNIFKWTGKYSVSRPGCSELLLNYP